MLFSWIARALVIVLLITLLRSVIGVVMKIVASVFGGSAGASSGGSARAPGTGQGPRRPEAPAGGELKKDPVCGTFIATATSLHKSVRGEVYYFCSVDCRDKFKA